MKIVRESLNEFHQTGDPLKSLDLGYEAWVHSIFDACGILREDYYIDNESVFSNWLDFSDCTQLTELPNNLTVDTYLNLTGCTELIKLPSNLIVKGDLNLTDCIRLKELPDNFYVGGSLLLVNCIELKELPNNLRVDWTLDLDSCAKLTELPMNFNAKYINVNIKQTKLIEFIKNSKHKNKLVIK